MKKILVFILTLLLLCTSLPVGAEIIDRVSLSDGELTISGIIPDNAENEITVSILAENVYWTTVAADRSGNPSAKSLEKYTTEDDIYDYLAWFGQISAQPGSEYTINIPGYTGPQEPEIRFRLGENNYYIYSPGELIKVNNAADASELRNAYESSVFLRGTISDIYNKIGDDDEFIEYFWQACLNYRNGLENGKFEKFDDAITAVEYCYFIAKLDLCTERISLEELYNEFADYGEPANSYDIYNSCGDFSDDGDTQYMSEEQKDALAKHIIENKASFADVHKFVDNFNEQIVLFALSSSKSKEFVADILTDSSLLKGKVDGYNKLSRAEKLKVASLINEKPPYDKIDSLVNALSELCAKTNKGDSSGGGSGGGGGSSGTVEKAVSVTGDNTLKSETTDIARKCQFNDIEEIAWAKDAIYELYNKGIISGRTDTVFDPHGKVSRAEFVKMLVLALGKSDSDATSTFSDSKPEDWHYKYISSAVNLNLVNGLGDGKFGVSDSVSRQDMAVMLARALNGDLSSTQSSFADNADISNYAKGAVSFVNREGIMNGTGNNYFEPLSPVTRAQAAKVIYEILKKGAM